MVTNVKFDIWLRHRTGQYGDKKPNCDLIWWSAFLEKSYPDPLVYLFDAALGSNADTSLLSLPLLVGLLELWVSDRDLSTYVRFEQKQISSVTTKSRSAEPYLNRNGAYSQRKLWYIFFCHIAPPYWGRKTIVHHTVKISVPCSKKYLPIHILP